MGEENKAAGTSSSRPNLAEYVHIAASAVYSTFTRFPFAVLMCAFLAGMLIYRIEAPYLRVQNIEETLDRLMLLMALGIPLSLNVDLVLERLQLKTKALIRSGSYAAELVLLALYYMFLLPNLDLEPAVRLLLLALSLALGFFFIPYLPRKRNFEVYVTQLLSRAVITAFFTLTLAIGIIATLRAVKALLYNGLDTNYYIYAWILAWFVFAPLHFLHAVPQRSESFSIEEFNKVLKVLLLYIVLPVITVYTIVLYLYFGKILITWEWPSGIVAYLVLSYAAAGIAALFLVSPFRHENRWARIFCSVLPKLILPLLAMMFVSISIRIQQFGVTENRYFVVAIGIWAAVVMLFYNFDKGRSNIVMPLALAVIMVLSAIGPWSAFSVARASQAERFYEILDKYHMIEQGQIVANENQISAEDKREITAILRYFDRAHQLSDLEYLPQNFTFADMEAVFGFTQADAYLPRKEDFYTYYSEEGLAVDIAGYDLLLPLEDLRVDGSGEILLERELLSEHGTVGVTVDDQYQLILELEQETVYSLDLRSFVSSIYDKHGSDAQLTPGDLTLAGESSKVSAKLVLVSISGHREDGGAEFNIGHIRAFLLVKFKS